MKAIKNEIIRETLLKEIARQRRAYQEGAHAARLNAAIVDSSLEKLTELNLSWFGTTTLYVPVSGETKGDFSAMVEKIALCLGEPPDIRINPHEWSNSSEYIAEFPDHRVHVYLSRPTDCQLIETEEPMPPRKVLKPHPACIAALSKLEEIA